MSKLLFGEQLLSLKLGNGLPAHPGGQQTYRPQSYGHRLAESFRRVAGFRLTWHYATTLLGLMGGPGELGPPIRPTMTVPFEQRSPTGNCRSGFYSAFFISS